MSQVENSGLICAHLDDPYKVMGVVEIDIFAVIILALVVGVITRHMGYAVILGGGLAFAWKRFKANNTQGFLIRAAYWFIGRQTKALVPSHLRTFIG